MRAVTFVAIATLCLLAACANDQRKPAGGIANPADMTGEELRALLGNGLTLKLGGMGEDYNGEVALKPDGSGDGQAISLDGRKYDITGTWTIEGDRFCRKWAFNSFEKVCETWRKTGQRMVEVFVDGNRIGVNAW